VKGRVRHVEIRKAWRSSIVLVDLPNIRDNRGPRNATGSPYFSLAVIDDFVTVLCNATRRSPLVLVVGRSLQNRNNWLHGSEHDEFMARVDRDSELTSTGPRYFKMPDGPHVAEVDVVLLGVCGYLNHHIVDRSVFVVSGDNWNEESANGFAQEVGLLRDGGRFAQFRPKYGWGSWKLEYRPFSSGIDKRVVQPAVQEESAGTLEWLLHELLPQLGHGTPWRRVAPPIWSSAEAIEEEERREALASHQRNQELLARSERLRVELERLGHDVATVLRSIGKLNVAAADLCEKVLVQQSVVKGREMLDKVRACSARGNRAVDDLNWSQRHRDHKARLMALGRESRGVSPDPQVSRAVEQVVELERFVAQEFDKVSAAHSSLEHHVGIGMDNLQRLMERLDDESAPVLLPHEVLDRRLDLQGKTVRIVGRVVRVDSELFIACGGIRILLRDRGDAVHSVGAMAIVKGSFGEGRLGPEVRTQMPNRVGPPLERVRLRRALELFKERPDVGESTAGVPWLQPVRSRSIVRLRGHREEMTRILDQINRRTREAEEVLKQGLPLGNRLEELESLLQDAKLVVIRARSEMGRGTSLKARIIESMERDRAAAKSGVDGVRVRNPAGVVARRKLPDVVGLPTEDAYARLKAAGIDFRTSSRTSTAVLRGHVIEVSSTDGLPLRPGVSVESESRVVLSVSLGPPHVSVPDIRGKNRLVAEHLCREQGLNVEVVEQQTGDSGLHDIVADIHVDGHPGIGPGDQVVEGSRVTMLVGVAQTLPPPPPTSPDWIRTLLIVIGAGMAAAAALVAVIRLL